MLADVWGDSKRSLVKFTSARFSGQNRSRLGKGQFQIVVTFRDDKRKEKTAPLRPSCASRKFKIRTRDIC